MRLVTVGHRLKFCVPDDLLVLLQPVVRELLDVGRRYAFMEAEVARLSQQTAGLQGELTFSFFLTWVLLLSLF